VSTLQIWCCKFSIYWGLLLADFRQSSSVMVLSLVTRPLPLAQTSSAWGRDQAQILLLCTLGNSTGVWPLTFQMPYLEEGFTGHWNHSVIPRAPFTFFFFLPSVLRFELRVSHLLGTLPLEHMCNPLFPLLVEFLFLLLRWLGN
jgi:hypothetical protein